MATSTSSSMTSTSSASASASATGVPGNNSPATGSPLLFFVALGFGVVFTNLWIIVGVKYCFRYNQRNRQPRTDENGEIDMATMPRPHRRRREKKLMSMDEVNERFPLTKYKAWRMSREKEGLPAEGGVAAPSSRPASVKGVEGALQSMNDESKRESEVSKSPYVDMTTAKEDGPSAAHNDKRFSEASDVEKGNMPPKSPRADTATLGSELKPTTTTASAEEEEDDEHIQTAVPQELLANPGDSCAICLETLEDDDDVRGLTCGHAFHASCLDPWLTNRRACCPLCKADYFVPKPRPEGEDAAAAAAAGNEERSNRRNGANHRTSTMPEQPSPAWPAARNNPFRTRMMLPGRFMPQHDRHGYPVSHPDRAAQQTNEANEISFSQQPNQDQHNGSASRTWTSRLAHPFSRNTSRPAEATPPEVSFTADPSSSTSENPSDPARAQRSRFSRLHFPSRARREAPAVETTTVA